MNRQMNVGIVGCGEIAQISHIPYLIELPQFKIEAICDLSPNVVHLLGEKYQISNRYVDYHELVRNADLDIVLVCNKSHAGPALAAMEEGKHVFVEKPIALNLKQADEMILSAKENDVKLLVGYMKQYDPAYGLMKQLVSEIEKIHLIRVHDFAGTYGINQEIYELIKGTDIDPNLLTSVNQSIESEMLEDIGLDRKDLLNAHDIMIHLCIHDINALHGLYGLPEKILSADLYDDNFVSALMKFENGVNLVWETGNLVTLIDWDEQITVYGSEKLLELRFPFPYLKNAASEVNIVENLGGSASRRKIITSYDEAFKREWKHFYACITNDLEPLTNGVQARKDLQFAVELTKAAAGIK